MSTHKTIELELPWPPSGNVQTRHTRTGGHYLNPKVAAYRSHVAHHLLGLGLGKGGGFEPLVGPLKLSFIAVPPNRRATDADNRLKCLLDALVHGGLLADDSNKVVKGLNWDWVDDPVPNGKIFLTITIGDLT